MVYATLNIKKASSNFFMRPRTYIDSDNLGEKRQNVPHEENGLLTTKRKDTKKKKKANKVSDTEDWRIHTRRSRNRRALGGDSHGAACMLALKHRPEPLQL